MSTSLQSCRSRLCYWLQIMWKQHQGLNNDPFLPGWKLSPSLSLIIIDRFGLKWLWNALFLKICRDVTTSNSDGKDGKQCVSSSQPRNGWDMQKRWFDPKGINRLQGGGGAGLADCCVGGTIWQRQSKMMITWKKDNLSWLPLSPLLPRENSLHPLEFMCGLKKKKEANWHSNKENIFYLFLFWVDTLGAWWHQIVMVLLKRCGIVIVFF